MRIVLLIAACFATLPALGSANNIERHQFGSDVQLTVERNADLHTRIVRATGYVPVPIEEVWKAITDFKRYDDFIPRCPSVMLLDHRFVHSLSDTSTAPKRSELIQYCDSEYRSCDTAYLYNEIDIVFPLGSVRTVLEMITDSSSYTIRWRKVVGPVRIYRGEWRLRRSGRGTIAECKTEFRLHVWVPPVIVRGTINFYFPRIIHRLRERCLQSNISLAAQKS